MMTYHTGATDKPTDRHPTSITEKERKFPLSGSKGAVYTSAKWNVRPGNEKRFVETWKKFADWTGKHQRGTIDALLLQEADDPSRFMSLGSWKDMESVGEWRRAENFKRYLAELKALCDGVQIRTLKTVAEVESR